MNLFPRKETYMKSHIARGSLILAGTLLFTAVSLPGALAQATNTPQARTPAQAQGSAPTQAQGSTPNRAQGGTPNQVQGGSLNSQSPAGTPGVQTAGGTFTPPKTNSPTQPAAGTPNRQVPGGRVIFVPRSTNLPAGAARGRWSVCPPPICPPDHRREFR